MPSSAALSTLLGACATAVALAAAAGPPPASLDDDAGSDVSLLQVRPANLHRAGSKREVWPNPADPDMQPTTWQKSNIARLKQWPHDMQLVNSSVSRIAITPVWYVIEVNGYKVLFDALHEFADEPTVQMNAWRGLSDQSHTELGSRYINDYGGRNEGIRYMVEQLKAHPKPREAECADHLTYAYEVLQCISGLFRWDTNGTRGQAAVEAGLLEQLAQVMRREPGYRPTMDVCCNCLARLLEHNTSYAPRLLELGVKELAQDAVQRFAAYDPTPFYFGSTYGEQYPVTPGCSSALQHL